MVSVAVCYCCYCFFLCFNNRQFNETRGQNRIENNYNNKYEGINVHTRFIKIAFCCWLLGTVVFVTVLTLNTLQRLFPFYTYFSVVASNERTLQSERAKRLLEIYLMFQ